MKFFKIIFSAFILTVSFSTISMAQSATASTATETTASFEKTRLKVKGATCKVDLGMIVDKVKKLKGVKDCVIAKRGATSSLDIEYNAQVVTYKEIKSAIETTGTCTDPNARRYKVKL